MDNMAVLPKMQLHNEETGETQIRLPAGTLKASWMKAMAQLGYKCRYFISELKALYPDPLHIAPYVKALFNGLTFLKV